MNNDCVYKSQVDDNNIYTFFFSGLIMRVYTCLTNKMVFPKTPSPVSEMKINLWMRSLQIISMIFSELGKPF